MVYVEYATLYLSIPYAITLIIETPPESSNALIYRPRIQSNAIGQ